MKDYQIKKLKLEDYNKCSNIWDMEKVPEMARKFLIKEDIPYCFYKDPQYGFIGDIFVEATYRRNGYGRLLTNCAIDWLLKMEMKTIRLLASENAKKLYQELGFQGTDEMVLYR
ncbi:GNAT family N-acetyltransferase [Gracilibacillus massiliensis]|uniref:GNAT family N-acetyltransferase n=1 Tax=Gracilibacillus massiliensis TaxID=1564956 RepID=UPI00071D7D03|nr:GNAT family N-acetyltransferase [Gracilibacillus massiliensis]